MKEFNEALARRWFQEVWNERKLATIDELVPSEVYGDHEISTTRRREDYLRLHADLVALFPDIRVVVEDVLADDRAVVARWSFSGTCAASGAAVTFSGMSWLNIVDGKIAEGWDRWNPAPVLAAQAAARARAAG